MLNNDAGVIVDAEISRFFKTSNSDGEVEYKVYAEYEYDGVKYDYIYDSVRNADEYEIGEIVSVKINPDNPDE